MKNDFRKKNTFFQRFWEYLDKKNKLMNKDKMSKRRKRKGDPIVRQRLEDINKDRKIERFIEDQREKISLKDKIELDFFV